jgi:type II secretory pathway pseudopilin PulG
MQGVGMIKTPARRRRGEAGFTLVDMLFVVAILGLLASMAIPGLMRARGAAQASSALGTMRVVNSAQLTFAISCGLGFYSPDFPTLGIAPPGNPEGFLPPELSSGFTFEKSGYVFSLAGTPLSGAPATCNGLSAGMSSPGYAAVADPIDPSGSTGRYFGTNSDGLIYQDTSTLSTTMPETGGPPSGSPIQ